MKYETLITVVRVRHVGTIPNNNNLTPAAYVV